MKVIDVMSREVMCCAATDTLDRAADSMWKHDLGALVVIDSAKNPIAMVTDRDIAMCAALDQASLGRLTVEHCMSRDLWVCAPEDPVDTAEQVMGERRVRRLPVMAGGLLVGIVSVSDIAHAVLDSREPTAFEGIVRALAAITRRSVRRPDAD